MSAQGATFFDRELISTYPILLSVRNLKVSFGTPGDMLTAVHSVSFDVPRGGSLGIVGESGSGKSVTVMGLLRLLDPRVSKVEGTAALDGSDILRLSPVALRSVRGAQIGFVFQDPTGSLNPSMRIGRQVMEPLLVHGLSRGSAAYRRVLEMLELVGINEPRRRIQQFPHELSGGMRQRVMIAAALIARPKLVILDEPTTALDVSIQAQILDLLAQLRRELQMSMLIISHDLGVVARLADRVNVMYAGRIVEDGPTQDVLANPRHPYTRGLIASRPSLRSDVATGLVPIPGQPPALRDHNSLCPFLPRCTLSINRCETEQPSLVGVEHTAACWVTSPPPGHAG